MTAELKHAFAQGWPRTKKNILKYRREGATNLKIKQKIELQRGHLLATFVNQVLSSKLSGGNGVF